MRKKRADLTKYLLNAVFLILAIIFIARFAGQSILKLYIQMGIGDCQKIPILCLTPQKRAAPAQINNEYIAELAPREFPRLNIHTPKGFDLVKETITRIYYKKKKKEASPVIYLLYEDPGYFPEFFPQISKKGITTNYDFIKNTMYATFPNIKNLDDAFFVIMKSVFTPDIGEQKNVLMEEVQVERKKGFINYNIAKTGNFFDCNMIDEHDGFYKIYIKDKNCVLDLNKVLAIVSTAEATER